MSVGTDCFIILGRYLIDQVVDIFSGERVWTVQMKIVSLSSGALMPIGSFAVESRVWAEVSSFRRNIFHQLTIRRFFI